MNGIDSTDGTGTDSTGSGPFLHGTKADLAPGELLTAGFHPHVYEVEPGDLIS